MKFHRETLRQQRRRLSGGQHRRTIAGAIIASTIAGVLALGASPTSATENPQEVCYAQVAVQERIYEKPTTVERDVFRTDSQYKKFTQTRTATESGNHEPWGQWGPWTDWGTFYSGAGNLGNGWVTGTAEVIEGPAPHGNGQVDGYRWERQYRYQRVGERQVKTGTETVPGPNVSSGWTRDTLTAPWVLVGQRTVNENGARIPCDEKPPTPDPDVSTKWGDCITGDDTVFGEERTVTYKYVLEDFEWVKVVDTDVTVNVQRPLSEDEQAACQPPDAVTESEWVDGNYECDDTTVMQTRTKTVYSFEYVDGVWVNGEGVTTQQTRERPLTEDEFEPCPIVPPTTEPPVTTTTPPTTQPPTTQPPTTQPPTTQPPTTQPPTVEPIAEALPPFQSTAAQGGQLPATSAVSATELPATGSSTWSTILLAFAALGAGAAFLRLSRRSV